VGLFSTLKMIVSFLYQFWDKLSDEDKEKIKQKCLKMIEDLIRAYYKKYRDQSKNGTGENK